MPTNDYDYSDVVYAIEQIPDDTRKGGRNGSFAQIAAVVDAARQERAQAAWQERMRPAREAKERAEQRRDADFQYQNEQAWEQVRQRAVTGDANAAALLDAHQQGKDSALWRMAKDAFGIVGDEAYKLRDLKHFVETAERLKAQGQTARRPRSVRDFPARSPYRERVWLMGIAGQLLRL